MPSKAFIAGLAVLAAAVSILAFLEPRFPGDLQATLLFQSIHSATLLSAMEGVSYAVSGWRTVVFVALSGLTLWCWIGKLEGGMVVLSGLIIAINGAFKILINRPRPTPDLVTVFAAETGKAFPSGHAFFAVVVIGMLAYLVVTHQDRTHLKMLTLAIALILILWIGAARVYLGVHWTSDVIGGYLVGSVFLAGQIRLYQVLRARSSAGGHDKSGMPSPSR